MWYKYFVDFRCSILVFANILYGIAVLGTLNATVKEVTCIKIIL